MIRPTVNHHKAGGGRLSGRAAVQKARAYLQELTGTAGESVSGLTRTEDGWAVTIEVLELERIPHTTDLMASYVVQLDQQGELAGYHRVNRYSRGHTAERR